MKINNLAAVVALCSAAMVGQRGPSPDPAFDFEPDFFPKKHRGKGQNNRRGKGKCMNAITNKFDLPAPLVEAVRNDGYSNSGTLSVTTLIKPPQAYAIELQHKDELTEDASDRIWALLGQATHTILERAASTLGDDYLIEERFFATLEGMKVSGQCDVIQKPTKTVQDYKVTSAYAPRARLPRASPNGRSSFPCWRLLRGTTATKSRAARLSRSSRIGRAGRQKRRPRKQRRSAHHAPIRRPT
jgi:hypothetical protein